MSEENRPQAASLDDALALMRDLRARCEWDAAQTHESLRPYLIEEAHEVDEAIGHGDDPMLRDELGDLLLQVLFHAVVAEERKAFDIRDVAGALIAKMHARHPHLYGDGIRRSWETMKAQRKQRSSLAEGIPHGLPALHKAHRLQDRAAGAGFDWDDATGPLLKVREEVEEVSELLQVQRASGEASSMTTTSNTSSTTGASDASSPTTASDASSPTTASDASSPTTPRDALESELGDLLFAVVNLCRKTGVHAELALDRANRKFVSRYDAMERIATERGIVFGELTLTQQDALWDEVKRSGG